MERTCHRNTSVYSSRRSRVSIRRLRACITEPPILSLVNARRAAIVLLKRCGEVAIAVAVLRAQEAGSSVGMRKWQAGTGSPKPRPTHQ